MLCPLADKIIMIEISFYFYYIICSYAIIADEKNKWIFDDCSFAISLRKCVPYHADCK